MIRRVGQAVGSRAGARFAASELRSGKWVRGRGLLASVRVNAGESLPEAGGAEAGNGLARVTVTGGETVGVGLGLGLEWTSHGWLAGWLGLEIGNGGQ